MIYLKWFLILVQILLPWLLYGMLCKSHIGFHSLLIVGEKRSSPIMQVVSFEGYVVKVQSHRNPRNKWGVCIRGKQILVYRNINNKYKVAAYVAVCFIINEIKYYVKEHIVCCTCISHTVIPMCIQVWNSNFSQPLDQCSFRFIHLFNLVIALADLPIYQSIIETIYCHFSQINKLFSKIHSFVLERIINSLIYFSSGTEKHYYTTCINECKCPGVTLA